MRLAREAPLPPNAEERGEREGGALQVSDGGSSEVIEDHKNSLLLLHNRRSILQAQATVPRERIAEIAERH